MKNITKLFFLILTILLILSGIIITILYYNNYIKKIEGMKITLIGGSNMEEKENINSMGYFIRSKNGETIIIDGGRDVDSDEIKYYIDKFCNGKVNHWFITHGHSDHVGALIKLILEDNSLIIDNLYYSLLSDEWYKQYDKRGYESEHKLLEILNNNKIKHKIECKKNQVIMIDNIICDIIRVANPEVIYSDNGNDASMVFKLTATDVNKSMLFLGDAYVYTSKELLLEPKKFIADAVQMSHHGQNGVSKEVYDAINPKVCFYNCPKWLWNNDNGCGYNSGKWQTLTVRKWMKEKNTINFVAFEGNQTIHFNKNGFIKIKENPN